MNPAIQMKGGWLNPCVTGIYGLSVVPRLLAAFILLTCFPSHRASAATCTSSPTNIIGWWLGDGNANDFISTNNGSLQGGATATAPGMVGSAFTFDGTNSFVQIPNSASLRPTNLTIEAWVRFSSLDSAGSGGSPAGDQYIVFRQNTRSSDFEGFDLSKTRVGGSDVFRFLIASASGQTAQINSSTTISAGTWYHVAAVRGSNFTQIYVNGVLERGTNVTFAQDYGNFPLYFGTSGQSSWDHKLKGNLDEVSIYGRALSPTEIAAIYAAGSAGKCKSLPCDPAPSGVVSWRPADGTSNDSVTGLNDTLVNGVAFASGKKGQALSFDGVSGYATNSSPGISNILNTYTVEFWAWPAAARATTSETTSGIEGISGQRYAIFPDHGADDVGSGVSVGTNGVSVFEHGDVYLSSLLVYDTPIVGWTHIAVVYVNQQPSLYLNGTLVHTGLTSTRISYPSTSLGEIGIGYGYYGGLLDEISIYNRALSAAEIQAIYHADVSGKCPLPPSIAAQPVSQTNYIGGAVTFSVLANGTQPLSYQWRSNSLDITGATNSSLLLTNVQLSYAANYSVRVTNVAGTITSSAATLTVLTLPPCDPAPSGLLAWWAGENTTADSQGLAPGTVAGTGTFGYAPGKVGRAFVFDGIHRDRVDLGNPANLQLQNFTIETWARRTDPTDISRDDLNADGSQAGEGGLIVSYGRNGYGFGMMNSGQLILSKIDIDGIISTNGIVDTNWHHVAVTKVGPTAVFYIDGNPVSGPISYNTTYIFNTSISIGSRGDARGGSFYGMVDEPAVYNRALSASEIAAIYTAGANGKCPLPVAILIPPTNQTGYVGGNVTFNVLAGGSPPLGYQWRSNSVNIPGAISSSLLLTNLQLSYAANYSVRLTNAGFAVTSSVASLTVLTAPPCDPAPSGLIGWWPGQGTTADIAGGSSVTTANYSYGSGEVGQGFVFNGSNNFINIGNASSLQLSNFTIEAWIKRSSSSVVSYDSFGNGVIFGYGQGGYGLYLDSNGIPALSQIGVSQTKPAIAITNTSFHHLAVTKSNSIVVFYVDGFPYSAPSYNPGFTFGTSPGIGARSDNHDNCFFGAIDEPSVYNRPLSAAEVQGIYNAGVSGKCPLPPRIVTQPLDQSVPVGSSVSFIGYAAGSPALGFQWYFKGSPFGPPTTNAPGAFVLNLSNVQPTNAGSYQVVITNPYGAITSAPIALSLTYPSTITAWGYNAYGQCNVPAGLDDVVSIAAGGHHSLALRRNGTVVAWGWNGNGQCNVPVGLSNVVAIAGGTYFSAALRSDGTVVSWGDLYNGSLAQIPSGLTQPLVLDSGGAENLVMKPDATLIAWGYGGDGRLNIPAAATNIIAIAAGHAAHNLALRNDRTIVGWGDPGYGALNIPAGLNNISQIDVGWGFGVVLKTDGSVAIWGSFNDYGGTYLPPSLPPLATIAAGYEHVLGIKSDGTVVSWGHDRIGQTDVPAGLANVVAVSGGLFHSLALSRQGPPEIFQPPSDEVAVRDGPIEFVSGAVGDHLQYQWKFNGMNLSGGTLARLLLTNVQPAQAGLYSVAISNTSGSILSSNATLSLIPLLITSHPTNQTIFEADTASFTVAANGTGPFSYQWLLSSTPLPGQTNQNLILSNVDATQAGLYSVIVSNTYGSAQSSNASLTVNLPAITNQPVSQSVIGGQQVTFIVGALGSALTYQWQFNGSTVPGATNTSITLTNVSPDNAGSWSVAINNSHRTILSSNAILSVNPLVITQQPISGSALINSNVTFTAAAAGTAPILFQWQKDGQNLTDDPRTVGATSNVLSLSLLQTNDSGAYTFIASNAYISVTSQVATLTVLYPPVILQNPVSQTNLVGSNVTLIVSADGRPPLGYRWTFNGGFLADGTRISGSSTLALTISNLLTADSGNYAAVVTNSDGAITSAVAVLTIVQPPTITVQPLGRLIVPGLPTTFTASATGTAPLAYQWQLNGSDIPTATNSSLTISNVVATNFGAYHLVVTNLYGAATSADALLAQGNVASWPAGVNVPLAASNIVMLSAGNNAAGIVGGNGGPCHVLALRSDGVVVAWGNNSSGQTNVPLSATNVVAVAAGGMHSLALRADGTIVSWGYPAAQNIPAGLSNVIAIAAGTAHSLAIRSDGKVFAWGLGISGQTNIPANLVKAIAVAAGAAHSLVQRYDGTLVGFGLSTDDGQRGTPGPAGIPAFLGPVSGFSGGTSHSIAVRTNGTVSIWGSVVFGITNIPVAVSNVLAVSASDGYTLALRPDGAVVGWGNPKAATNVPPAVSNAIAVAAGSSQAFALIGDGRPVITSQPIGGTTFVGRDYTFRAITSGLAPLSYRWQSNGVDISGATNANLNLLNLSLASAGSYQLIVSNSLGTATSVAVPLTVLDNPNLAFISQPLPLQTNFQAGKLVLTAGIAGNGPLSYQWNLNGTAIPAATNLDLVFDRAMVSNSGSYVLSVSNLANSISSVNSTQRVVLAKAWGFGSNEPPATLTNAIAIASGYGGEGGSFGPYLALRPDGKVVAWGTVLYGETNPPPSVTNFFITAIAAGLNDALALRSDGTVAAWGLGVFGQTNPPASATNVIAIACGDSHDLALRADGTVIAWGQGANGQTNVPVNATNIVAISGGGNHALALRGNGTIAAWGLNSSGQTTVPATATNIIAVSAGYAQSLALRSDGTILQWGSGQTPTPPAGLTNIVAIAAGYSHNIALRNDGTLVFWGFNYSGNVTIPADMANVIQISTRGDRDLALFGTRAPGCTVQPWDRFLIPGSNTTFVAKFAAPPPVTYQWQYNGSNISGATTDTLVLTNLQASQAGNYQLIASNSYGSAVTRPAALTLPNPPVITVQPLGQTNTVGSTILLNVSAIGYPPLVYQWRQNGSNNVGINSNVLLLSPATRTNSGVYSVLVSNPGGTTASSNATVKVLVPQKFAPGVLITNGSVMFFSGDSDGGLLTTNDLPGFTAQASSNLVDWVVLPNALSITNGLLMLQDADQPNYPARFYRILER